MRAPSLVSSLRRETGLSVRGLAQAAGVAASTVHRIERGDLHPTVETLDRLAEAAGMRLRLDVEDDYAASLVGLARFLPSDDAVRMAAELVHRHRGAEPATRSRMISGEPAPTGDGRWDAFLGALAEWLAVTAGDATPAWAFGKRRYLAHGWWVTPMKSVQAWEYAGSPLCFKVRGVYLHRNSIENV